jgi:hypothetical protein
VGSVETDYCAPLAKLICQRASACNCGAVLPTGMLDEMGCESAWTAKCLSAYAPYVDAVNQHAATVDAKEAAACVALIASDTPGCEAPRGTVSLGLCPAWVASEAAIGDKCQFPICAGGAGYCAAGYCVARPTEGVKCQGMECAPGLLCLNQTCEAPKPKGGVCQADDECAPPLRCVTGKCGALGKLADACVAASDCELGRVCAANQCASAGPPPCADQAACGNLSLCASLPHCIARAPMGGACNLDEDCQSGLGCDAMSLLCLALPGDGQPCHGNDACAPGLACAMDFGNCAPLPGDGMPCAFGPAGPFECAAGLGCNAGVCSALPKMGEACTVDNRCAVPLGCDFTAQGSICVARKPVGGACQNDQVCDDGLHCDFAKGACAKDSALGAPCPLGNECGTNAECLLSNTGEALCAPIPKLGELCLSRCVDATLHCAAEKKNATCIPDICAVL